MDLILLTFTDKWADWELDGFPSRTAALARALEAHPGVGRLLVVDVPSSFAAAAARGDLPTAFEVSHPSETVSVLGHRRLMPRERHHPVALHVNAAVHDMALAVRVRKTASELGMSRPVALHAGPLTAGLFGRLGESVRVYDAVDDWTAHPAFSRNRAQIAHAYDRIRAGAELVTAVSTPLADLFRGGSASVAVLRNAVDDSFVDPVATTVPSDLAALQRPVVGYTGALESRVDAQLIAHAAAQMPDVSFALVGPVADEAHFAPLRSLANVAFLGPKNHDLLAGYIRGFDACMMPHRDTPLTRMMDPIKLHEYIAAGRPVVMTDVGDSSHLDGHVRVAKAPEDFVHELRVALSENPPDPAVARAYACDNCWARRADEFLALVEVAAHA